MSWVISHFEYYLRGRKFKVITDHSALTSALKKEIYGNQKLERMRECLQEFNFSIEYKKRERVDRCRYIKSTAFK